MFPRWLATRLMRIAQGRAARRLDADSRAPDAAQWRVLRRILQRNRGTEIGRRYGFADIDSIATYQRRVPLHTAEELAPYVARMAAGEPNVLLAQAPHYFCQTGGTTGEPKLSPVNADYTREYQSTVLAWGHHLFSDHPDVLAGQILYFVGTAEAGRTAAGIPYGTMSGYTFGALPAFIRRFYALPAELSAIHDFEAKYYTALRLTVPRDVRMLVSITPSTLLVLGRQLQLLDERIIDDIRRGTLDADVPASVRPALSRGLRPDPVRADELTAMRRRLGRPLLPRDVWPNLRLVACWKSGPSAPYVSQLASFYGEVPIRDAIYSATEGWMNVPLEREGIGGVLAVGTHFFEFFPASDTARAGPPLLASQLEKGERYSVILTASSGVYRYDLRDVVQCVGLHHATPVIAFSHKEAGFSNVVGEKLSEHHVTTAVTEAAEEAGVDVRLFTMAPAPATAEQPAHYRLFAELQPDGDETKARRFLAAVEEVLRREAWEYAGHRDGGDLGAPELAVLQAGAEDAQRAAALTKGGNDAQLKPKHLVSRLEAAGSLPVKRTLQL